ncbi:MAG TPA: hypothetical protein VGB99_03295 [Acidobacteriota bacterium]
MEPISGAPNPDLDPRSDKGPSVRERVEEGVRSAKDKFNRSVSEARETVEQKTRAAQRTVEEKARQARDVMEEKAQEARERFSEVYHKVQDEMRNKTLEELFEDGRVYVRNNPMKSLGAAVVVGMLVGRLLRRR